MPSTANPFEPYLSCIAISHGISTRHGSHQVAQKFTRTTFPLKSAKATSLSFKSFTLMSGAVPPSAIFAGISEALVRTRVALSAQYTPAVATMTMVRIRAVFFIMLSTSACSILFHYSARRALPPRRRLFAGQRMLQPERDAVQKTQLADQPRQTVEKY